MFEFDLSKPYCYYFNEIAKIPHGSFNEKAISDYIVNFAKERNLEYIQDKYNNVVIYKKASKGYENSKPVLLQAHMDMVCEKNKSSNHDFLKDGLELEVIDEEWLSAKGTTLGADDGCGVVYMLAILDDDSLDHPDLECCFTVQEETGLGGALILDTSVFKARRMVSLDGSGENSTATSSSGGCEAIQTLNVNYIDNTKNTYRLFVTGLLGGHSASEIHKEKGNAIKTAVRILKQLEIKGIKLNVSRIDGGLKHNAIPRECEVIFTSDSNNIESLVNDMSLTIKKELEYSDPGIKISVELIDTVDKTMDDVSSKKLIDYLFLSVNGFRHRSMAIEGLTLASLNMGIIRTNENEVVITTLIRSAMSSHVDHLLDMIDTLANIFDIKVDKKNRYPGWNYKENSELRNMMDKILLEQLGCHLECRASHGGLECGIFADISEEMDIITYGPIQKDIHTPDERLNLPSFDRSYKVLTTLLKECK